jgi:hypothetical protein
VPVAMDQAVRNHHDGFIPPDAADFKGRPCEASARCWCIPLSGGTPEEHVADRLHSAAIHLLRRVARQDAATGLGPARLSALSVIVFGGQLRLGNFGVVRRACAACRHESRLTRDS